MSQLQLFIWIAEGCVEMDFGTKIKKLLSPFGALIGKFSGAGKKAKKVVFPALALFVVYLGFKWVSGLHVTEKATHVAHDYKNLWSSLQHKADELKRADLENQRLKLETESLRKWAETLQFNCTADVLEKKTDKTEKELNKIAGSSMARIPAGIQYTIPTHLLPPQLYVLRVSYFKAKEDEKAAVILTYLTGLEENDQYRTPANLLMTGISWYRIDYFKRAEDYFDRVVEMAPEQEYLPYQAQARMWKAIVAERTHRHEESQNWLKEVIDHHPKSLEASWVNGDKLDRVIATEEQGHKATQEHKAEEPKHEPEHKEEKHGEEHHAPSHH